MSDVPSSPDSTPKDGFDFIEYPCDFAFKAMCRTQDEQPAADYIRGLITPMVDDNALLKTSTNTSRTGKFESVTAVVRLQNREQLEAIYLLISQSSRVVMTL
ncbi:DUF493 domain-containing protein [Arenicella xantha]|uniref:Uncharacterized protein n=1 Tax=Arenicella xantha TaxID=644221 RepID=A0A395JM36_9GAMM|nr:DUF493 domain-containing protein [Arenicella xantha]RBP50917.1 hypothetical protein DFR28_102333 [Arenicella xantha]